MDLKTLKEKCGRYGRITSNLKRYFKAYKRTHRRHLKTYNKKYYQEHRAEIRNQQKEHYRTRAIHQ